MKQILAVLLLATTCFAADTTVVVKAVNMETGAVSSPNGGSTYTWHSMNVEVDGVTYKIAKKFRFHETWLHKGTYVGRWKGHDKKTLEVDMEEEGKIHHVEFQVLGEE